MEYSSGNRSHLQGLVAQAEREMRIACKEGPLPGTNSSFWFGYYYRVHQKSTYISSQSRVVDFFPSAFVLTPCHARTPREEQNDKV
jgi:hypothetical protein